MRLIGALLFGLGIIMALISATKLPVADSNWSDMLLFYVEAIAMALIGLLLLHWPRALHENLVTFTHTDFPPIIKLLQELIAEMDNLRAELKELSCEEIATQVKFWLDTYVLPFAAKQQEISTALGQNNGVDVLLTVAQGERLLNRMWSAASDENIFEVITIYPKALAAFEEACCKGQDYADEELH